MNEEESVSALQVMVDGVLNDVQAYLEGHDRDEAMADIQVLIGCLYDVMAANVGARRALMLLGMVMNAAAVKAGPETGVHVELLRVPKKGAQN